MKAVKVENLSFSYAKTMILKDASFSISEGTFVGIIGPNGGGKTTLLHLLMGFLKPQKGTIEIFGHSPEAARSSMAWVPQVFITTNTFPFLS